MLSYAERLARVGPCIDPNLRLTHAEMEELTGRSVPPRIADQALQGSRLLVILDPPDEMIGKVVIPETTQALQQKAAGCIVAVGPEAGQTTLANVGNILVEKPEYLLGLRVIFQAGAIRVVKTSVFDDDYKSDVAMISTNDIWMIDCNENPWQADAEFKDAFERKMQELNDAAERRIAAMRQDVIDASDDGFPDRDEDDSQPLIVS